MSGVAVVVVDLQRDFLDERTGSPSAHWEKAYCVPSVNRLLTFARDQQWRVVHVGTRHRSKESLPYLHRIRGDPPYCLEGTAGLEFVVTPEADDVGLYKTWYSAFETDLDEQIADIDTIVWAGVSTDCCIQASAFDADRRGLRSIIPFQTVSASSRELYSASLAGLGKSVATIANLDALIEGADLQNPTIQIDDIVGDAEMWFNSQKERVGDVGDNTSLSQVLHQLGIPGTST